MDNDERREPKAAREEFEVAYYTKELGRPLQRKLLQRQFANFADSSITAASSGDESPPESKSVPSRKDRPA